MKFTHNGHTFVRNGDKYRFGCTSCGLHILMTVKRAKDINIGPDGTYGFTPCIKAETWVSLSVKLRDYYSCSEIKMQEALE